MVGKQCPRRFITFGDFLCLIGSYVKAFIYVCAGKVPMYIWIMKMPITYHKTSKLFKSMYRPDTKELWVILKADKQTALVYENVDATLNRQLVFQNPLDKDNYYQTRIANIFKVRKEQAKLMFA